MMGEFQSHANVSENDRYSTSRILELTIEIQTQRSPPVVEEKNDTLDEGAKM
jgi:hypothetical protein